MDLETVIVSGAVGAITSAITAYFTSKLKISEERDKWNRDFVSKYSEARINNPTLAANMTTQFGIAMLIFQNDANASDGERSKSFLLPNSRIVIGRAPGCDIVVADPIFSQQQLAFSADSHTVFLETLGATNLPLLNGELVEGRHKLRHGDVVKIGKIRFTLVMLS